jgi:hypothetical protein
MKKCLISLCFTAAAAVAAADATQGAPTAVGAVHGVDAAGGEYVIRRIDRT